MALNKDWLPTTEDGLIKLMAVWSTKLANASLQTAYGWVATECTSTIATITAFNTAYATYHTTPTETNRIAKDDVKKAAIAAMRKFAAERIRFNAKMTPAQRKELGVRTRDTEPTPIPPPSAQAEADITWPARHTLKLALRAVPGTPPGPHHSDYGYRIYYGVMPPGGASVEAATGPKRELMKAPVSGDELPHSRFTRRQSDTFDFEQADSGKTAYFCIRFENAKGEPGPWGPMLSAVIS
ncbi:MAG: hypothetical protein LBF61_08165 [Azoarcus sp.]|jgi:hypothetical protein|nr:hypothetical protein [Azoarcus sp.]